MKKQLTYVALTSLLVLSSNVIHAVTPGGMVAVYDDWQNVLADGFDRIDFPITITDEPGNNGYTFWANQFNIKEGDPGYFGLQQRGGKQKYLNFSIWQASGWQAGYPANCRYFDHEGSGVQCDLPYAWQEGVKYTLSIERLTNNLVSAKAKNHKTGDVIEIARITLPSAWKGFDGSLHFIENFYQSGAGYPSCSSTPSTSVVFHKSVANSGISPEEVSSENYGDCASIANSYCVADKNCVGLIKTTARSRIRLKNGTNATKCISQKNGSSRTTINTCASSGNNLTYQRYNTGLDSLVRYNANPANCLIVDSAAANTVKLSVCDKTDSKQVLLPMPNTGAIYNLGTEKCLEATNGAAAGSAVKALACSGKSNQKWTVR